MFKSNNKTSKSISMSKQASDEIVISDAMQMLAIEAVVEVPSLMGGIAAVVGASLGLITLPFWAVACAILGAGGLAYSLIKFFTTTTDTLKNLKKHLETLDIDGDENNNARAVVTKWITEVGSYITALSPQISDNPRQAAINNASMVNIYKQLIPDLKRMIATWPQVTAEGGTDDWKFTGGLGDLGQTKDALDKALNNAYMVVSQMRIAAQQRARELIDAAGKQSGSQLDYVQIADDTYDLYKQVKALNNYKDPAFDTYDERFGYNMMIRIVDDPGGINPNYIVKNVKLLTDFRDLLKSVINGSKVASTSVLSKRALTLLDGRTFMSPGSKSVPKVDETAETKKVQLIKHKRDPLVIDIQSNINAASNVFTNVPKLRKDGIYGKRTAGSLNILVDSIPGRSEYLAISGITSKKILNHIVVRNDPKFIELLKLETAKMAQQIKPRKPRKKLTQWEIIMDKNIGQLGEKEFDMVLQKIQSHNPQTKEKENLYDVLKYMFAGSSARLRMKMTKEYLAEILNVKTVDRLKVNELANNGTKMADKALEQNNGRVSSELSLI